MTTALYVGRFQPLHKGHATYIRKILSENDKLVVVIGSAQEKNTEYNPFSVKQRKKMLELCFNNITIKSAIDFPGDNEKWFNNIKKMARFDIVYAGENQLVKKIFQDAGYKVKTLKRIHKISSTKIRELMRKNKEWRSFVPESIYLYVKSLL